MKRILTFTLAAMIFVGGYSSYATANEPEMRLLDEKVAIEGNRHRRKHRRGGSVRFGFGNGGYYGPRQGYYYAPPPPPPPVYYGSPGYYYPGYYYAPPPPRHYYGGSVIIR